MSASCQVESIFLNIVKDLVQGDIKWLLKNEIHKGTRRAAVTEINFSGCVRRQKWAQQCDKP